MKTGSPADPSTQLDVVFEGTWVMVPSVDAGGHITAVNVYSPSCGHPQGVTYYPGLHPNPWPAASAFYMLDSHSHTLDIQRAPGAAATMPVSGINTGANHCLKKARGIGSNWDLLISLPCGPDSWASSGSLTPTTTDASGAAVPCLCGTDAPTGNVSSTQTLSYYGVTAVDLCGASAKVQALLPTLWNGQGTLIFQNEISYVPTLEHERAAIRSMATLAGLDLALDYPLMQKTPVTPPSGGIQPFSHAGTFCGYALIILP
jgi:hypothetical protein